MDELRALIKETLENFCHVRHTENTAISNLLAP